jgi:hypothetical protein
VTGVVGAQGPIGPKAMLIGGNSGGTGTTSGEFMGLGMAVAANTEANTTGIVTVAGTISHLYFAQMNQYNHAITATVRVNGVNTAVGCTTPNSQNSTCSDTTSSVTVAVGDKVTVYATWGSPPSNGPLAWWAKLIPS